MNDSDHRKLLYSHYSSWKSWGGATHHKDRTDIFRREVDRAGVTGPAHILEIGFGDGQFMDWARENAFAVCGVEQIESQCDAARNRGHEVFCGDAVEVLKQMSVKFDLIVLFDVCEHLTIPELIDLFTSARARLATNGKILARFPNGGSPFSGLAQNGDATHITTLTGTKVDQICRIAGLRLSAEFSAFMSETTEKGKGIAGHRISKIVAHKLQSLLNVSLSLLYFGGIIPLSAVMVVHLEEDN